LPPRTTRRSVPSSPTRDGRTCASAVWPSLDRHKAAHHARLRRRDRLVLRAAVRACAERGLCPPGPASPVRPARGRPVRGSGRLLSAGVSGPPDPPRLDGPVRHRGRELVTQGRAAARRARPNTAAAMAGPLPAADNPRICSGKSLVPGLRAVPLPQLRTHSPGGAVDRRRPRLLTRFWPENWQAPGHVCLEIRMSTWK
jgi:hypothetical protein